ncbi:MULTISPECIES: hypothetical protein [unclassified Lysobacter]|uniref:hypothetical protein n=1 Tax=unclassified Lysobacter TaxID=2635362 RepID=UPI000A6E39B9|nr:MULTISPECIES: hypothetical protein [unclassified Lysobacter]
MSNATVRISGLCALAAALAMAGVVHAAGKAPAKSLSKDALPAGFAVGKGQPPLTLKVDVADGKASSTVVSDAAQANVTASGGADGGETMLTIRHDLAVAIKFDLYISSDGERFEYTSSCAVTPGISSFEMWSRPIRAFALGNPRVVPADRMACD